MNPIAAVQPAMTEAADDSDPTVDADAGLRRPTATEELVREHGAPIRRLIERLTAWSPDAGDLTQDVFAAAILAWPSFRGDCATETWLTRIAIHRCRRWNRRRRLARLWRKSASIPARVDGTNVSDALSRDETNATVQRAVAGLPAKYREVVVLRYLEERTANETAEALGLRSNTVDVRLHRARRMLAEVLAPLNENA